MNSSLPEILVARLSLFSRLVLVVTIWGLSASCQSARAQINMADSQIYYVPELNLDQWKHFRIYVNDWHSDFEVTMTPVSGNPDVYIRKSSQPTLTQFDFAPYVAGVETVQVSNSTPTKLTTGWYYISVHARPWGDKGIKNDGKKFVAFNLIAKRTTKASIHNGMGAIPFETGTAFRVWAPNANSVRVAGEFNNWSSLDATMVSEGNGNWSIDHRNANPHQRYKYVIRNGNQTLWRNDPREEQVTNSTGDTVIFDESFTWTDSSFQMPNWNEMVTYELHIGTLNDSPGFGPGSFNSAIARLDHIRDLGVNSIKVMPVNEFPGGFSWGYNPSYPFAVETDYGGTREFKRFVNEAHARGIAVILDLVFNHFGPNDMDLWRFDGWAQGNWGGIYFYPDERSITPWGNSRPDFGRPEVRQYIRDNVLMWTQDFHVDGIRIDSTRNIHTHTWGDNPEGWSLLQWLNNEINATQPWKIMIAEDLQNNAAITRDTGVGGAGFDAQWSAGFVHPVRVALQASSDAGRDMNAVRNSIAEQFSADAFERVIYTESHDEVANGRARVPEDIWPGNAASWPSQKRSTLGAALVMTAPGIPMIFQGQEILEDQYFRDDDPVDWSKEITHAGIKLLYTDLIKLRRNWYNNTRGLRGQFTNVFHVNNNDKVIAFHRWSQGGPGDDVIVVCNFSSTARDNYRIGLPRSGVWNVRFNSDWSGYSNIFGNYWTPDVTGVNTAWDGLGSSGIIRIAPYSAVILSQDAALKAASNPEVKSMDLMIDATELNNAEELFEPELITADK